MANNEDSMYRSDIAVLFLFRKVVREILDRR